MLIREMYSLWESAAPRGFEPDQAAKRRRDAGGPAAVGRHADRQHAGGNRRRRTSRRAAWCPFQLPGIARHLGLLEIVGGSIESHAELGSRRPSDGDQSGPEIIVDQRIGRLDGMALEQLRSRLLPASGKT